MIGICGDDCLNCPRYRATGDKNPEALEKVRELWVKLGLRDPDFPAKELVCHGCKPENQCAYPELFVCARAKALDNCGLCPEYPCELIDAAFEKSAKLYRHVAAICSEQETAILKKAFFSKKQNLDQIHEGLKKEKKRSIEN